MGINLFFIFSIILLILGETVGFWYVKYEMNIPDGRHTAAIWVYQLSILTLIVQLFRIPDNATIIANERMSFYAYLSIAEAVLKLLIVFILDIYKADKLILYAFLYLSVSIIINVIYKVYCKLKFKECRFLFLWDQRLFKELITFSGLSLLNSGTRTVTLQMENIFLNRFYGVSVNSARGIASQVYNAVNLFITNFQTAFKPQLIKTYAAGQIDEHHELLNKTSKFSFYLLLILVIPIMYNMDALLAGWLLQVPIFTKEFCKYVLLAYLVDALAMPLWTSIAANGNIKGTQVATSLVFILQLCVSFWGLKQGYPPYIVSILIFISHFIQYVIYIYYSVKLCGIRLLDYVKRVLCPLIPIILLSPILPMYLQKYSHGIWQALGLCILEVIWVLILIYCIGLNNSERNFIKLYLIRLVRHQS